jgi:hypothetical protein
VERTTDVTAMSQLMEWEAQSRVLDAEGSGSDRLHAVETQRLRQLLRRTCCRLAAPEALRQRILSSLPHRGRDVGESAG